MKKYIQLYAFTILLFLASCSGSSVYQGNWKGTDPENNKFEIDFEPKSFKITDADGNTTAYQYTQNSVQINNSEKKYEIQLSDGRKYMILFPISSDTTKAILTLENGQPQYVISRTSYISHEELYKLAE